MNGETTLLVERPRLGRRGWVHEARIYALYVAVFVGFAALGGVSEEVGGWGSVILGSAVGAVLVSAVRMLMFIGWKRRRLTVTDRAIRIGSVLVPLADIVDLRTLRGPQIRHAEQNGEVSGAHRWRVHESHDHALLVSQRQLDGSDAGWMFGTHDVDRLARVVGEHAGVADRPQLRSAPRPLPFRGRQGVDRFRAGVLICWSLTADVVLWAVSDLPPVVTVLTLAALAFTGRRRVRIDDRSIQVGTAHIDVDEVRAVRCVERAEAAGASLDHARLPLFGPPYALLVHAGDGLLWALSIPHPVDVDRLAPDRG